MSWESHIEDIINNECSISELKWIKGLCDEALYRFTKIDNRTNTIQKIVEKLIELYDRLAFIVDHKTLYIITKNNYHSKITDIAWSDILDDIFIMSIDSADNFQTLNLTNELDNIIELDIERDSCNYISEIRLSDELSIYLFDIGISDMSEAIKYYNFEEV